MIESLDSFLALIGSPITLLIIILVGTLFAVLPTVLFFKLWGMANDVKKITKIMESNQAQSDEFWTDQGMPAVEEDYRGAIVSWPCLKIPFKNDKEELNIASRV